MKTRWGGFITSCRRCAVGRQKELYDGHRRNGGERKRQGKGRKNRRFMARLLRLTVADRDMR